MSNQKYISKVSASGLKGVGAFSHELAPITIIVGKNFSGKTALLDAARLALLGYHPEVGKRSSDIFDLSAGGRMEVSVVVGVQTLSRSYKAKGDGSVSAIASGDFLEESKTLPLGLMLNPVEYFGLSDNARRDYVFGLLAQKDPAASDAAWAEIQQKIRTMQVEGDAEAVSDAINEMLISLAERQRDGIALGIALATTSFKEQISEINEGLKRMAGTVSGITVLRAQQQELGVVDVAQLDKSIEEFNAMRRELSGELQKLRSQQAQGARTTNRRIELQAVVGVETPEPAAQADIDALVTRSGEIGARISELNTQFDTKAPAMARAQADEMAHTRTLAGLKSQLEKFDSLKACPTCGASGEGWKDAHSVNLREQIETIEREVAKQHDLAISLKAEYDTICAERTRLNLEASKTSSRTLEVRGIINTAILAKQKRESAQAELDAMAEVYDVDPAEIQQIESNDATIAAKITALSEKRNAAVRLTQEISLAAEAEIERKKLDASLAAWKSGLACVNDAKEDFVKRAFAVILTPANMLWGGVCEKPLAFKDGEIGYEGQTGFVKSRTFSGAERALCYMAIGVGLASASTLRVCVLDEMARLDEGNQLKLLLAAEKCLAAGVISQFIGVLPEISDAISQKLKVAGCKVIQL